ncbi:MAG: succinate--CoA ligase subunit beta [Gammaproteobacteria bacterium]|nr:succinate--CoA ligase subunit beta [Gammaproteobacteria bacterium]MCF6230907.1 succinate--CoA ligase subunit beta [Gammaproteobacteria bacterium]
MNLHEFQAKKLFREAAIPVPLGEVVDSPSAAVETASRLGGQQWIVKAQVHAGARAAAGGVRCFSDLEKLRLYAKSMLGERLITAENAPDGQPVNHLLIEAPCGIKKSYRLSLMFDPLLGEIIFQGAALAPVDGAPEPPSCTPFHVKVDRSSGLHCFQRRQLAVAMGVEKASWSQFFDITHALYQLFIEKDLLLIEVDSLVESERGEMMVLDARVQVDDNALYRQPQLAQLEDLSQDDFHHNHTDSHGLGFITMEGDISCIVNGTGLALATLDMIQLKGGQVANIIDVNNEVSIETLAEACGFVWQKEHCKSILINIVGGIVQCNIVAAGVLEAMRRYGVSCPVVARIEGSLVEEAKLLFTQAEQRVDVVQALDDAIVAAVLAADS